MGFQPLLLSLAVPKVPLFPKQHTQNKEKAYLVEVSYIVVWLQRLGGNLFREAEQSIQQLSQWYEATQIKPTAFFYYRWANW